MKQFTLFEDLGLKSPNTLIDYLSELIDINEIIPYSFFINFYSNYGRKREYTLQSFVSALLLQKMFTIPTDTLLITILNLSQELRDYCGFYKGVPDKTQFSKFKTNFAKDIEGIFHQLVDITEPICNTLGKRDAQTLIIDTTGIEPYVKENNPKHFKGLINKLNALLKTDKIQINNIDKSLLAIADKKASANDEAKLQYINGHFAYGFKGTVICNSHGILRHLQFDNYKAFSDNPEKSKYVHDSTLFKPALNSMFQHHPNMKPKYIVGDSGFDSSANHNSAFKDFSLIPIICENSRNTDDSIPDPMFDDGYPCCPKDSELHLYYCGVCKEPNRATRFKYMCPKAKFKMGQWVNSCEAPCSSSKLGFTYYMYEPDDIRSNPIIPPDSDQYKNLFKKRHIVEQVISRLKLPLNMGGSYLRNTVTSKSDFFMAGIAHLVTVLLAFRLNLPSKVCSTKSIS